MIRKAYKNDIKNILPLLENAKEFLKENSIDQWQGDYPNQDSIIEDIKNEIAYVYDNDGILGYFSLCFNGEATYDKIYDGKWLTDKKYGVMHRVCVSKDAKKQGVAHKMIDYCSKKAKEKCYNMRIDTHEDNTPMNNLIKKSGYIYCGIVRVDGGAKRKAYEINL